jgi:hypothetical protein
MKFRVLAVLVAILAFVATPMVHAAVLAPGGSAVPDTSPFPAGETFVADMLNQTLGPPGNSVPQTLFGTYSVWVYRSVAGTLDFYYQLNLSSASTNNAESVTAGFFRTVTTDAGYLTGSTLPTGASTPTSSVPLSVARGTSGDPITWSWVAPGVNTPITPGQSSQVLFVFTNATTYTSGTFSAIDSTTSANPALGPVVPSGGVPEPASVVMMGLGGLGVGALALVRRRKRNA